MSKIETIEKALKLLAEVEVDEGVVEKLEAELGELKGYDADVSAFRNVVLDRVEDDDDYDNWEDLSEINKNHYREQFGKFKKFFDELGQGRVLGIDETPNKELKYKDTDGDVWFWDKTEGSWCYRKPTGNEYPGFSSGREGFPGGVYTSLFPMEVVR